MGRRVALVAVTAGAAMLAGCSLKDAFSGHADVVARAGGQELTVERVAAMVAPVKQIRLQREVIDRVADLWVDYQLLGQALAGGDSLLDSATVAQAMWPLVAQTVANHLHDSLVATSKPTAAQVDSAYNGNDFRYVSHILVAVRQDTIDAVKTERRRVAEGYLGQVRGGADFHQLAARVSDDPGSKPNGGRLGLVPRGIMVRPFEDAAFALQPGQISNLVETAYGYHIIWRPALAAVRDSFATELADIFAVKFDSMFLDSLTNKTGITVRGSAPAAVRAAAQNLRASKARNRTLATFRGGRLSERDFARWLQAFPMQTRGAIGSAPDSTLREFVRSIARNEMLMRTAAERRIGLTPADWDSVRVRYRQELTTMLTGMGIAPESLAADTSVRTLGRQAAAARRVDAYFADLTGNNSTRQYFEVPPFLADVLRSRAEWQVNPAGVDRALERARVLRGPETPPSPSPMMTPAPIQPGTGGPPLPEGARPVSPPQRTIR